jgi:hypothetical protein
MPLNSSALRRPNATILHIHIHIRMRLCRLSF